MTGPGPLVPVVLGHVSPGVWSVDPLPADTEEQMTAAGFAVIDLDLQGVDDKDTLLALLGRAGRFPAHYGQNWDAAYDCLSDIDGRLLIVIRGTERLQPTDAAALRSVVEDAIEARTSSDQSERRSSYCLWEHLAEYPSIPHPTRLLTPGR